MKPRLRAKLRRMAERGTEHERSIAQAVLDREPNGGLLTASDILEVDDSAFGPSAAEVDAALAAFYARGDY